MVREEVMDLFTAPRGYCLAHCISGDFALGAGIAKEFDKRYNMRARLHELYPDYFDQGYLGSALAVDEVFNLVTKDKAFQKPTYEHLRLALEDMKTVMNDFGVTKVAMPLIGCGLDRLEWSKVKNILEDIFSEDKYDILVCRL